MLITKSLHNAEHEYVPQVTLPLNFLNKGMRSRTSQVIHVGIVFARWIQWMRNVCRVTLNSSNPCRSGNKTSQYHWYFFFPFSSLYLSHSKGTKSIRLFIINREVFKYCKCNISKHWQRLGNIVNNLKNVISLHVNSIAVGYLKRTLPATADDIITRRV